MALGKSKRLVYLHAVILCIPSYVEVWSAVLVFILVTAAIEAFYISIFLYRYKTTGKRNSKKRESILLRSTHQENSSDFRMKSLPLSSTAFCNIAEIFHETMPMSQYEIVGIDQIWNRLLMEKYEQCVARTQEYSGQEYSGRKMEKLLFHGTRAIDPSEIYQGDSGFDMRMSQVGMWGKGNYFAVNASYSDNYAHRHGEFRQILVAKVVIGVSQYLKPDSNLRQPPFRTSRQRGLKIRYDSVCGETNGSVVYVTYENERAYPLYLITYKCS